MIGASKQLNLLLMIKSKKLKKSSLIQKSLNQSRTIKTLKLKRNKFHSQRKRLNLSKTTKINLVTSKRRSKVKGRQRKLSQRLKRNNHTTSQ
jgi:hypothetical protein